MLPRRESGNSSAPHEQKSAEIGPIMAELADVHDALDVAVSALTQLPNPYVNWGGAVQVC